MSAPNSEMDRLDSQGELLTLVSGTKVSIQRLKLRQLFRLLRIITRGGAGYLPMLQDAMAGLGSDDDRAEAFGTQLIAIAIIALPEAEDEAVDFIMSVVEPEGISSLTDKNSRKINDELRQKLAGELYNPEPEDAIGIIEAVINREKQDLVKLGKRLSQAFSVAEKTGQLKTQPTTESTEPTRTSSVASPAPSISFVPSTDGPTTKSST